VNERVLGEGPVFEGSKNEERKKPRYEGTKIPTSDGSRSRVENKTETPIRNEQN